MAISKHKEKKYREVLSLLDLIPEHVLIQLGLSDLNNYIAYETDYQDHLISQLERKLNG